MSRKTIKISIIIIVIIFIVFGLITWQSNSIISQMANTRIKKDSELIKKYSNQIDRIEPETDDGLKISAWRFKEKDPRGIVIVLHGMHGQDASSLLDFGHFFNSNNYEVFCLDMRAHGNSEGKRIGFGYTEVRDVNALLNWIRENPKYKNKKIILYGISMGGATAINTAAERKDVSMVISVSAFTSYEDVFLDYMRRENIPELIVEMFKPSIRLIMLAKYRMDPVSNSPINKIKKIKNKPIFLIHGDSDEQILAHHALDLNNAAGENVKLWIVKGKKHMVVTDILDSNNDWYREEIINYVNNNL